MTDCRTEEGWRLKIVVGSDFVEVSHKRREVILGGGGYLRWSYTFKLDIMVREVESVTVKVDSMNEEARGSLGVKERRLGSEVGLLDSLPEGGVVYSS